MVSFKMFFIYRFVTIDIIKDYPKNINYTENIHLVTGSRTKSYKIFNKLR